MVWYSEGFSQVERMYVGPYTLLWPGILVSGE